MKQVKRWGYRTISQNIKISERGSIVLEATLTVPFVLMVLVVFLVVLQLPLYQMAVHGAASQLVRQTATSIYPVALAAERYSAPLAQNAPAESSVVADALRNWVPAPAGELLAAVADGDTATIGNIATSELARTAFVPLLHEVADDSVLNPDRLRIQQLTLPDLFGERTHDQVNMKVEYRLPLRFPFMKRPLSVKDRVTERAWLADDTPSTDPAGEQLLQIVQITPAPVRLAKKATLTVIATPGSVLSVTIRYKSGTSKAKYLTTQTVSESGQVSWTWFVSGNTTPGVWEAEVRNTQGQLVAKHFVVQKMINK